MQSAYSLRRRLAAYWPWGLLLLALLCFGAANVAMRYEQLPGDGSLRPDVARLAGLVNQAINTAGREAEALARRAQLPDTLRFRQLGRTAYPTFVAVDGQLVAWTAAGPAPTTTELRDTAPERLTRTALGDFLVVRRSWGTVTALAYVPLARRYGINNRYLREGTAPAALLQGLNVQLSAGPVAGGAAVRDEHGHYLFWVAKLPANDLSGNELSLALLLAGAVLYAAAWLGVARCWGRKGRGLAAAGALVGPLALLRVLLLGLGLPYAWVELPLFDPRVYGVSGWAPSLGDLLLNGLLALLVAVAVRRLARHYALAGRAAAGQPGWWGAGAVLAMGGLLLELYKYYLTTFGNSQLSLDITQSIQFSGFRVALLLAVLLHTAAVVLLLLLLVNLLLPDLRRLRSLRWLPPVLTAASAALLVAGTVTSSIGLILPGLLLGLLALLRLDILDEHLRQDNRYYLLLLLLGVCAAVASNALTAQFNQQLLLDKQRLAGNLLVDNDLQGEFLLGQRLRLLAADPAVARLLTARPARPEALRRRIARQYLRDYFDKYEEDIDLFAPDGRPLVTDDDDTLSFDGARRQLARTATPTDQTGVYLLKSANSFASRRYAAVVAVLAAPPGGVGPPAPAGNIILYLNLKQLSSYSVLPELLVDQKFFQPGLATDLSYGGYAGGRLVYSEGDFDYANELPASVLQNPRLYQNGLTLGGYHQLAVRGTGGRVVVVTSGTYTVTDGLANFSFQLLANMLAWALLGGLWQLGRGRRNMPVNFSARIQLLLNVGIVLPLLVVSVATASQVISSYRRDLRHTYERRGRIALESLRRRPELLADTTARPALTALARNVAALTETDLNLYDAQGQLLVSSQPLIFEAGLLGTLANPQAVADLRERGLSRTLLTERAGSLSFQDLYLPLRAASGAVRGYVGIPFFDSQKELDGKLTELFTTILNIFTLMFLVFLALALLATRQLTAPLRLLAERLTRTTLTEENQPLTYRAANDEIGLLVREYNSMLSKLEASKRELAAQEKESAWREMARQVAHEIKNPLTPMKLNLQYLQKSIAERRPNVEELISRISQSLITQIDVLSDIATSFSTFTNLPTMRPVRLDVAQVLQQCVELFRQTDAQADGSLSLELPSGIPSTVFADESLLVRTFNNLLLNALQAVPPGRAPHQQVRLSQPDPGRVRITIRDNGTGIPEDVQDKVFRPNFTTKATGSGIGLAVAKRGIESAGGRLWFETVVGEGTTFFIELPLAG